MAQVPRFDPSRIRLPESERTGGELIPGVLTPRRVNEMVQGAIHRHIPPTLHVLGEIGDISRPRSGHVYFSLKDKTSELACVMWRSAAARLKFDLETGLEVIATGSLDVYLPRGRYQLVVRTVEPRGVGALEIAFRQLKDRLAREGLFDPARKKPLPLVPRRIALITSPHGAAVRDMIRTIRRRFPPVEIVLFPVQVQGDEAAGQIAAAIRLMNEHAAALGGIDVAIVGRGGGSLEDLWAFNEEIVARAIAASRIPIVSAVGHEVDVTIADLVADVRAATPTAAGELVAPVLEELLESLDGRVRRARAAVLHKLELAREQMQRIEQSPWMARPLDQIAQRQQQLDETFSRLALAIHRRLHRERDRLADRQLRLASTAPIEPFRRRRERLAQLVQAIDQATQATLRRDERQLEHASRRLVACGPQRLIDRHRDALRHRRLRLEWLMQRFRERCGVRLDTASQRLEALNPRAVLRRGYSITRDARTGRLIRSVREIRDRMRIRTELADGDFLSTADDPRQPGLFDPPRD